MTEEEFETSLEKHRKHLVGYARSYVDEQDRAEDTVQDACIDLLRKYSTFIPKRPGAEKYWYRKFVWYCVHRSWRREARHKYPLEHQTKTREKLIDGDDESPQYPLIVDPHTLADSVGHERYQIYRAVWTALGDLPIDISEAIWGHFVLEQTWEEVGAFLGLKASEAESIVRPYVNELRKRLEEWEGCCSLGHGLHFKRFGEKP